MYILDLTILLLHNFAQIHGLILKPLQGFLQGVNSAVQLHFELLFGHCLFDEEQFLLYSEHVSLNNG